MWEVLKKGKTKRDGEWCQAGGLEDPMEEVSVEKGPGRQARLRAEWGANQRGAYPALPVALVHWSFAAKT